MVSWPIIALSCICIAVGRYQIRRLRRMEPGARVSRRMLRRLFGWGALMIGFVLMILGVLFWGVPVR